MGFRNISSFLLKCFQIEYIGGTVWQLKERLTKWRQHIRQPSYENQTLREIDTRTEIENWRNQIEKS